MQIKIIIGVPTGGSIKSKTALSIVETVRQNSEYEFLPVFQHGNLSFEGREKITEVAQNNLASHLFMLDGDMSFPADTIKRLLAHDKDIVGVLYNYRRLPLQTTAKFFGENGEPVTELKEIPDELFKVAALGTGCLLIKMSVFDKLKRPYFPIERDDFGNVILTEDVGFCEMARDAGVDVWCDPTIRVSHIGDYLF